MANRTSSTELNILQQNGVSHNFFFGGKSGVKFKKLGASRFLAATAHFFGFNCITHKSQQQINLDVEVVKM